MQISTSIPTPAILHKSVSQALPSVTLCPPLSLAPPPPATNFLNLQILLVLPLDVCYSCTPFCPSKVDVHPHSSRWWCPACLAVSTCATSAVNSFHLCYLQTLPPDHVLSRPARTPLCYFLWFWDPVYLSMYHPYLSVPATLRTTCLALSYIHNYFLLLCPDCGPPPHLSQVFCLSACAYLYPCNYFHMVLAVVCVLPDRQCLSENRCPMSVTSRIGIYIKVVVLRFLTH